MAEPTMLIRDRIPVVTIGTVKDIADPRKQGRIKVILPELGIEETGWIFRSVAAKSHRVPRRGNQVLVFGFMSGVSLTLFYVGVVNTEGGKDKESPGRGLLLDPEEYANSVVEDYCGKDPTTGIVVYYNEQERQFIIRSKGANAAQIVIDDQNDSMALIPGSDDIQVGNPGLSGGSWIGTSSGARLAMVGDTVITTAGIGSIYSGSVPMKATFPR